MKSFLYIKKRNLLTWGFFIFIAIGLVAPIASETIIPNLADYITHLGGILQAKMAIDAGQFPLRVAPFELEGLQYPYFQFYSPSGYTFVGALYRWLTPNNPLVAFKLAVICFLTIGGVYINHLSYRLTKSRISALLAGLVYLSTPYYLITVDHLGNLTESMALGLFPAVLYYSLRCFSHPGRIKDFLQMSLAWYLLATIHIVSFVYASFFTGLLLCMMALQDRSHLKSLAWTGTAYIFSTLLAMWYLAPIKLFAPYFFLGATINNASLFSQYSPLLSDLLFPAAGITPGSKSALITIHPAIGWPIVLATGICIYAFFTQTQFMRPHRKTLLPYLLILFLLAFVLTWSPLKLDNHLPSIITIGQYSWRLLSQTIWIGALLFAWAITWLFKDNLDKRHLLVGALILMTAANTWFPEAEPYEKSLAQVIKEPTLLMAKYAYLLDYKKHPQWVYATDTSKTNKDATYIINPIKNTKVVIDLAHIKTNCRPDHTQIRCHLMVPPTINLIELPVLYYPELLRITVNGKETPYHGILLENKLIAGITPEAGKINDISIEFRGLNWANRVSELTFGLWFCLLIFALFQRLMHKIR